MVQAIYVLGLGGVFGVSYPLAPLTRNNRRRLRLAHRSHRCSDNRSYNDTESPLDWRFYRALCYRRHIHEQESLNGDYLHRYNRVSEPLPQLEFVTLIAARFSAVLVVFVQGQ